MGTDLTAEQLLTDFVLRSFVYTEFLALLSSLPEGGALMPSVLPQTCPWLDVVTNALALLRRRGYLDASFFQALTSARPKLAVEIENLAQLHYIKRTNVPPKHAIRLRLQLDFDSVVHSRPIQEKILALLQEHCGDSSLQIEAIWRGSTWVLVSGTKEGLSRLSNSLQRGELGALGDIPIEMAHIGDFLEDKTSIAHPTVSSERGHYNQNRAKPHGPIASLSASGDGASPDTSDSDFIHLEGPDDTWQFVSYFGRDESLIGIGADHREARSGVRPNSSHIHFFKTAQPVKRQTIFRQLRNSDKGGSSARDDAPTSTEDEEETLVAAIARLHADLQIVLALSVFDGLSGSQIANVLDLPENTVRSRLRLGLEALRRGLAELSSSPDLPGAPMSFENWKAQIRSWIKAHRSRR